MINANNISSDIRIGLINFLFLNNLLIIGYFKFFLCLKNSKFASNYYFMNFTSSAERIFSTPLHLK